MMRFLFSIFCFFIFSTFAFATQQIPDFLFVGYDKLLLDANYYNEKNLPLEVYYMNNPDKKPIIPMIHTGCYRGYVATYIVTSDNKLYLSGVNVDDISVPAQKIMGYQCEYPIFCDWFSSENLRFLRKKLGHKNHKKISVKNGIVKKDVQYFNSEWASPEDEARREGVFYDPAKDSYQTWFDLREITRGCDGLPEKDYIKLYDKNAVAKTRGILRHEHKEYILESPATRRSAKYFKCLKNKYISEDELKKRVGKAVECELKNPIGAPEIVSIRELSKDESVHKKNYYEKKLSYDEWSNRRFKAAYKEKIIDAATIDTTELNFKIDDFSLVISKNHNGKDKPLRALIEYSSDGINITEIYGSTNKESFCVRCPFSPKKVGGKFEYVARLAGKEVWRYSQNKGLSLISDLRYAQTANEVSQILEKIEKTPNNIKELTYIFTHKWKYKTNADKERARVLYNFFKDCELSLNDVNRLFLEVGKDVLDKNDEIEIAKKLEEKINRPLPFARISAAEYADKETRKKILDESWAVFRMGSDIYKILTIKNFSELPKDFLKENIRALIAYQRIIEKSFPQNLENIYNAIFEYYKNLPEKERKLYHLSPLFTERAKASKNWDEKILYAKIFAKYLSLEKFYPEIEKTRNDKKAFDDIVKRLEENYESRKIERRLRRY